MKLSDRELVLVAYALNAVLLEFTVESKDRAASILYALTLMHSKEGEIEELSNYSYAVEQLRRVETEEGSAMKDLKTELFKEMSDA